MNVEQLKYTIWAEDSDRALRFYTQCFDATEINR